MTQVRQFSFQGRFTDLCSRSVFGTYHVTELKTRYLVTFIAFGYEFPSILDYVVPKSKNRDNLAYYIDNVFND